MKNVCVIYNINYGIGLCICFLLFILILFFIERRDFVVRRVWINIVNRKLGDKNWIFNENLRICFFYFVDGIVSFVNLYFILNLGYILLV